MAVKKTKTTTKRAVKGLTAKQKQIKNDFPKKMLQITKSWIDDYKKYSKGISEASSLAYQIYTTKQNLLMNIKAQADIFEAEIYKK